MLNSFGKGAIALTINGVALGVLGWVAWDTWQRGVLDGIDYAPARPVSTESVSSAPKFNVNTVLRAHLFGRQQKVKQPVQVTAPPTRLNLKLVGVIASGPDNHGLALIEVSRGRQEVIRVGQAIGKTGAKLNQVAGDHVLIERNGKLEKLSIKRPQLKPGKPSRNRKAAKNTLASANKPSNLPKTANRGGEASGGDAGKAAIAKGLTLPF